MKEIRDIIESFENAVKEGKRSALATVVHVEGSSYRRPGARMLVTEDGLLTGAISGGCLEGDALRKALLAINQQHNKLVTYDTSDEDDAKFGVQLGCNGIVHILFEPIDVKQENNPIALLRELVSKRSNAVLVTLFSITDSNQPGTSFLYREKNVRHSSLQFTLQEALVKEVKQALEEHSSKLKENIPGYSSLQGFIEFIPPPVSLVIAGAGNDALPLVEITSLLGWQVTVIDGRPTHATAARFPKASDVRVMKSDELDSLAIDQGTVFVLMTHNYNYDYDLLKQLVVKDVLYIGVLGPKTKLDRMLSEMAAEGITPTEQQLKRVHGPLGLDIGAETAEEIAVSLVAEIKSVIAGVTVQPLKEKTEPIHRRARTIVRHG
ncbi:MAG: XdhC/CoxI family protein [Chitinophagaceae bacterium]|nr:MAG: XdhC/CoxI family protein [Chitinophagaceae bacterium]